MRKKFFSILHKLLGRKRKTWLLFSCKANKQCCFFSRNYHSNIRTKEAIEASGAYERPNYEPGPSHCKCLVERLFIFVKFNDNLFYCTHLVSNVVQYQIMIYEYI